MKYFFLLVFVISCGSFRPKAPERKTEFLDVAWAKNLDPEYISGNLPIGLGSPRIFNDIVYQGSPEGVMYAYDLETGRVIWSKKENSSLGGAAEFFNDQVAYGSLAGRLYVRHYLTGDLKYAIDLGSPIESAPVYFDGRMVVYLRGHQIVHLDAETGKVLWVYKRAVPVTTTLHRTSRPLVLGNKIIVGFADGFVGALSKDEGLLLWETKLVEQGKFVDVDLNPILVGGVVVTGSPSGELVALNPENGAVVRSYGIICQSHPVQKGEQLILGTNDGEVIIMTVAGEILKRTKISTQPVSAVSWWKDHIIAASFDGMMRAVDPLKMTVVDEFAMGYDFSAVYSEFAKADNFLTIYTSRNHLYTFK